MTTTPLTDTAAALEAAIDALIDAEDIDTRATVAAEAGDKAAAEATWTTEPIALTRRTELRAAITAHVEAEVARRLAGAPEVEAAIVDYAHAVQSDFDAHEERSALLAAIASDKARAVANARRVGFAAGSAERSSVHDAIGVSPQDAARAAMAHGVPCPTCGTSAEWIAMRNDLIALVNKDNP